jgi:hypothetical protein
LVCASRCSAVFDSHCSVFWRLAFALAARDTAGCRGLPLPLLRARAIVAPLRACSSFEQRTMTRARARVCVCVCVCVCVFVPSDVSLHASSAPVRQRCRGGRGVDYVFFASPMVCVQSVCLCVRVTTVAALSRPATRVACHRGGTPLGLSWRASAGVERSGSRSGLRLNGGVPASWLQSSCDGSCSVALPAYCLLACNPVLRVWWVCASGGSKSVCAVWSLLIFVLLRSCVRLPCERCILSTLCRLCFGVHACQEDCAGLAAALCAAHNCLLQQPAAGFHDVRASPAVTDVLFCNQVANLSVAQQSSTKRRTDRPLPRCPTPAARLLRKRMRSNRIVQAPPAAQGPVTNGQGGQGAAQEHAQPQGAQEAGHPRRRGRTRACLLMRREAARCEQSVRAAR